MRRGKVILILITAFTTAHAGSLEEKWFNDLKKAQQAMSTGEAPASGFQNTSDFQSKKFEAKAFGGFKENGMEKKVFATRDFNPGKNNTSFATKEFKTKTNEQFSGTSSLVGENKTFAGNTSPFSGMRVSESKKAREDGVKAVLEREKSVLADMRYQGPETEKISQEIKLINETLKNKDDLIDHKISVQEIREILNKNK